MSRIFFNMSKITIKKFLGLSFDSESRAIHWNAYATP